MIKPSYRYFVHPRWLTLILLLWMPWSQASTLLIVGDSLSAAYGVQQETGWVGLLQKRLNEHTADAWSVVNASISGETTDGGLRRLPELLATHKPRITLIELGGNDGLRGFPVSVIRRHLNDMVDLARAADSEVILVGMHVLPNYGPRYSRAFHEIYTSLAREKRIPLVPFFLEGIYDQPGMMQDDRIHPTQAAQPILLENVWPTLKPLLDR